jgi:hypothetical protein
MKEKEKIELLGNIAVDSGCVWVGDPCYIVPPKENKLKGEGPAWEDFCEQIISGDPVFKFEHGGPGLGICTHTHHGDGYYPVYLFTSIAKGGMNGIFIDLSNEAIEYVKDHVKKEKKQA